LIYVSSWFALRYCSAFPLCLDFGIGFSWVEFLDRFRYLLWWFVSWGVPFWLVLGVLWANRFWFEVGSKFVSQVLLGCCDVSSDRPELEWWSKLNVWSYYSIGCRIDQCLRCWLFEELLLGVLAFWECWWFFFGGVFGVLIFFWCNTWDLIPYI